MVRVIMTWLILMIALAGAAILVVWIIQAGQSQSPAQSPATRGLLSFDEEEGGSSESESSERGGCCSRG